MLLVHACMVCNCDKIKQKDNSHMAVSVDLTSNARPFNVLGYELMPRKQSYVILTTATGTGRPLKLSKREIYKIFALITFLFTIRDEDVKGIEIINIFA